MDFTGGFISPLFFVELFRDPPYDRVTCGGPPAVWRYDLMENPGNLWGNLDVFLLPDET